MTNYEKIKTMSVEELAELLREFRCCVELDWCRDIERCRSCEYHTGYEMERPDEFGISYVCRRANPYECDNLFSDVLEPYRRWLNRKD